MANKLCVYLATCASDKADLAVVRSTDEANFDPSTDVQLQTAVVTYTCGAASRFNESGVQIESINFTCGLDGNWDRALTLPPCQGENFYLTEVSLDRS